MPALDYGQQTRKVLKDAGLSIVLKTDSYVQKNFRNVEKKLGKGRVLGCKVLPGARRIKWVWKSEIGDVKERGGKTGVV